MPRGMNRHYYLSGMCSQTALGGKSFAAYVAVERPVLQPLQLRLVVPQVLLEIGQLDEGTPTVGHVALVRPFTWKQDTLHDCFQ